MNQALQRSPRSRAAADETAMVEERPSGDLRNHLLVDVIVGTVGSDVEDRLSVVETHFHGSGRMELIDLQADRSHSPVGHRRQDSVAEGVIAHTADQQRIRSKSLEVPCNVERSATENLATVWETIEKHLPADNHPVARWSSGPHSIQTTVSGRKCANPSRIPAP